MNTANSRKQRILMLAAAVAAGLIVALGQAALAGSVSLPWTFTNGTTADANQVNANFQSLRDGVNDNDGRIAALERAIAVLRDHEWSSWAAPPDSPPDSSYVVNASAGTVTDELTGLMWQQAVDANSYTWSGASSYCASLDLGGYSSGWRLPTLIELESIVDHGRSGPAININAFPGTPVVYFWSSSPSADGTSQAWVMDFNAGGTGLYPAGDGTRVRCVR